VQGPACTDLTGWLCSRGVQLEAGYTMNGRTYKSRSRYRYSVCACTCVLVCVLGKRALLSLNSSVKADMGWQLTQFSVHAHRWARR